MGKNQYEQALRADQGRVRRPWDEPQFSQELAERARVLTLQDRVSTVLMSLTVGLGAVGVLLLMFGISPLANIILTAAFGFLSAYCVAGIWMAMSSWRNSLLLEAALFSPRPRDDEDAEGSQ
ncbi:MAG: hypothetical protein ACRDRQ_20105 [Pseudonocardiaceae bacterium]